MAKASNSKSTIKIDGRTKDEVIRDLTTENAKLKKDFQERWNKLCPQLPDEMRNRARAVWEAALHAHQTSKPGEPGPSAIIAAALLDAEKIGPRKLKGGVIDPANFIAERILSMAAANKRDPQELYDLIKRRLVPELDEAPTVERKRARRSKRSG